jgi:hypothetical protein
MFDCSLDVGVYPGWISTASQPVSRSRIIQTMRSPTGRNWGRKKTSGT